MGFTISAIPLDPAALAAGLEAVLARDWDAAALSQRFSRDWRRVAADTLAACMEARTARSAA